MFKEVEVNYYFSHKKKLWFKQVADLFGYKYETKYISGSEYTHASPNGCEGQLIYSGDLKPVIMSKNLQFNVGCTVWMLTQPKQLRTIRPDDRFDCLSDFFDGVKLDEAWLRQLGFRGNGKTMVKHWDENESSINLRVTEVGYNVEIWASNGMMEYDGLVYLHELQNLLSVFDLELECFNVPEKMKL